MAQRTIAELAEMSNAKLLYFEHSSPGGMMLRTSSNTIVYLAHEVRARSVRVDGRPVSFPVCRSLYLPCIDSMRVPPRP